MFNYNELFEVGNVILIENVETHETQITSICKETKEFYLRNYSNSNLEYASNNKWVVKWIVKFNNGGGIEKKVFDRRRDKNKLSSTPKSCSEHMPELETGDFIYVLAEESDGHPQGIGVIVGDKVVYKEKGYDYLKYIEYKITKVWKSGLSFARCESHLPDWQK